MKSQFYQDNTENEFENNELAIITEEPNLEINRKGKVHEITNYKAITNNETTILSTNTRMMLCLYCCNKFKQIEQARCPKCSLNKVKIKHSGYLYAFSNKNMLRKYYFVLHENELYGYSDLDNSKLKRVHILSNVFITKSSLVVVEGKNLFPFIINYKNNVR